MYSTFQVHLEELESLSQLRKEMPRNSDRSEIDLVHSTIRHHASALALNITTKLHTLRDDDVDKDFDRVVEISGTLQEEINSFKWGEAPPNYIKGLDDIMSLRIQAWIKSAKSVEAYRDLPSLRDLFSLRKKIKKIYVETTRDLKKLIDIELKRKEKQAVTACEKISKLF